MIKKDYDNLIAEQYVSRIAFHGKHPYIAPFIYVFDGKFLYFLSTKYGKKIELIRKNPHVGVEIENISENLTKYSFVTLQGSIQEVTNNNEKQKVKERFVNMIEEKNLSINILAALGHSPEEPIQAILKEDKSFVWKLVDVINITGVKTLNAFIKP